MVIIEPSLRLSEISFEIRKFFHVRGHPVTHGEIVQFWESLSTEQKVEYRKTLLEAVWGEYVSD